MEIVGYLKTSLIEWPGKISSVIFVPGCNFRCPFCHNTHLVDPKKIAKLPFFPPQEILADLKKRRKFIEGVVISGGEPTLQSDLPGFLKKCQSLGLETMVETNGSKPEKIKLIVNSKPLIVNYLAMDFKGPLDKRYAEMVGLKNFSPEVWIESFKIIAKSKIPFELRTTVVPTIHNKEILVKMARQLKSYNKRYALNARFSWFLQNFKPQNCLDSTFEKIEPFKKEELENLLGDLRKIIPFVKLRNGA